jgi:hypothetical protein
LDFLKRRPRAVEPSATWRNGSRREDEMKLGRMCFAVAASALVLSAPAQAIESISGTYAGKISCKGYSGTQASKSKNDVTIEVLDSKLLLIRVTVGAEQIGSTINSFMLEDSNKTDRGKVVGVDCSLGWPTIAGVSLEADAVVKAGSEKGTLKGTLTESDPMGTIDVCSFSVKRTATTAPEIPPCQFPE